MINKKHLLPLKKTFTVFLTIIFFWGYESANAQSVLFPDYFPLDPAVHGHKTFQWTYGKTGTYLSYISGKLTVPYTSGPIEGTGIVNFLDIDTLYTNNNGSEVKWLGSDEVYISTDQYLTVHPASWTFSTVTDDMLLEQGTFYFVDPNLALWEMSEKVSVFYWC